MTLCLTAYAVHLFSDPCGGRTRVARMRVSHPAVRRTGQTVSAPGRSRTCKSPKASGLRPPRLANAQPTRVSVAQKASPMGFEPTIACLTGRRALQTAPRGRVAWPVAQVGVEPTASLVLSQGGLPVAYRAMLTIQCPEQESNLQTLGFKPSRSAGWRTWADRWRP